MAGDPILRYDLAPNRQRQILELVRAARLYRVAELSGEFGVSEMTIRRDVRRLAAKGLVLYMHGVVGAVAESPAGTEFHLRKRQRAHIKRAIGRCAAELISDGDVIAIDSGTTALEVARAIPAGRSVSVVTHSLPAMSALTSRAGVELVGLGGPFHVRTQSFAGPATLATLRDLRVRTLFLAASAIREDAIYCGTDYDALMKQAFIEISDRVVILADSSKFQQTAMVRVAPITVADIIVVDDALDLSVRQSLEDLGLRVIVASVNVNTASSSRRGEGALALSERG